MDQRYFAAFRTLLYQNFWFLEALIDMSDSGILEYLVSQEENINILTKLVVTKGYGVWATTIGQNTRDQIARDRRSKRS